MDLKIERIAKDVGKNKSSFYHHFADLELFTDLLLDYHLEQSKLIGEKEIKCSTIEELFDIFVEHKIDLLFNRQLRVHRENSNFEVCFNKTTQISIKAITPLWLEALGLENNSYLALLVLKLSMENFYLQITEETLTHDWLRSYFQELKMLVTEFKKMGAISELDGAV
ncbi:MAG: hypothetical protein BalsKO_22790 [Balneolaceae bacterium]